MHFLWLILILHMLLKSYSLKINLSELTSGPCFISSIKFLKPFETISCTSLTIPGKWLFHSHLNYTPKHQKNIRNLLRRHPSLKVKIENGTLLHWVFWAAFPEAWIQGEPRQLGRATTVPIWWQGWVFRVVLHEVPKGLTFSAYTYTFLIHFWFQIRLKNQWRAGFALIYCEFHNIITSEELMYSSINWK